MEQREPDQSSGVDWRQLRGKRRQDAVPRLCGRPSGLHVCLIEEYATLDDYAKYANDFKTIRQAFELK